MTEETTFFLQAFDHAMEQVNAGELETKQIAKEMTIASGAAVDSLLNKLYDAFLLGIYEGMHIADVLNAEKVGGDTV